MANKNKSNLDLSADNLDAALADLSKAVEATTLAKAYGGVAIDTPEHEDERGGGQGKLADKSDFAGFDDLMIGKMQQTLADAGFDAADIAAFMKKEEKKGGFPWAKMEEEEEEEDEGEDEMGKSLDALANDPSIREGMDASPFLESMVAKMAERLDSNEVRLAKSLRTVEHRSNASLEAMAKALTGITTMVKGLAAHQVAVSERLGIVESQPLPARGASTLQQAAHMAKSMPTRPAVEQLSKSHVGNILAYMKFEKGIDDAHGLNISDAISQVESNTLRPEVAELAKSFLSKNAAEAATAINYR